MSVAVEAASAHLAPYPARLAIVGGSGLSGLADHFLNYEAEFSFAELGLAPNGANGIAGHHLAWRVGRLRAGGGEHIHFVAGRRHAYEGLSMEEVLGTVRLLAAAGVERLILTNAAGGLSPLIKTGDLMLIEDFLPLTSYAGAGCWMPAQTRTEVRATRKPALGGQDFSPGFAVAQVAPRPARRPILDPELSEALAESARRRGVALRRGVYGAVMGPNYETQAEARAFRLSGADAVGMSTYPEAVEAARLGVRVAAVSVITNSHVAPSAPTTHEEALTAAAKAQVHLADLLAEFLSGHGRS